MNNTILHGSAQDKLKALEADSIDCCITSPPYWALRDYKTEGQLGLESTFQEYIKKLVDIFSEVKRVLKKSGACWVNMGDTYSGSGTRGGQGYEDSKDITERRYYKAPKEIPEKSLCLIPERFAIAMVDQGWILRNKIIWYKPNCMPSSAKDRFTVDWEYLFFFTKSQRYYFETQYEPMDALGQYTTTFNPEKRKSQEYRSHLANYKEISPLGRIKRCVWKIATQPFSEAHFATFPPALVKTPLLATCPEYICKRCGKAREKIIEKEYEIIDTYGAGDKYDNSDYTPPTKAKFRFINNRRGRARISQVNQRGWNECDCNAGFDGGVVLDPFAGAGTVPLVALQNARNFVGIELNEEYIKMAMERLRPYLLQTRLL